MSEKQLKVIKKALDAVLQDASDSGFKGVSMVKTALLENLRRAVEDFSDVRAVGARE